MNPLVLDVADAEEPPVDPVEAVPPAPVEPPAPPAPLELVPLELVPALDELVAEEVGGAPTTPLTVITVPCTGAVSVQSASVCCAVATACCALFSAVWLGVAVAAPPPVVLPLEPVVLALDLPLEDAAPLLPADPLPPADPLAAAVPDDFAALPAAVGATGCGVLGADP